MTDFADRVEQNRSHPAGDGPQVEEDESLLDSGDQRRVALPQCLGQAASDSWGESETAATTATAAVGIG